MTPTPPVLAGRFEPVAEWHAQIETCLNLGRYEDALTYALRIGRLLVLRRLGKGGAAVRPTDAEDLGATLGLLAGGIRVCRLAIEDPAAFPVHAATLAAACRAVAVRVHDPVPWNAVAEILEATAAGHSSFDDLRRRAGAIDSEVHLPARALAHLVASVHPRAIIEDALIEQLTVMPYLEAALPPELTLNDEVLRPFVEMYWTDAFARMRFRFTHPRLVESALAEARTRVGPGRLRAIYRAVLTGVRCRLRPDLADWLHEDPAESSRVPDSGVRP